MILKITTVRLKCNRRAVQINLSPNVQGFLTACHRVLTNQITPISGYNLPWFGTNYKH